VNIYGRVLAIAGVIIAAALALTFLAFAAGGIRLGVAASDMLQGLTRSLGGRAMLAAMGVGVMFAVAYLVMRGVGVGASKVLSFDSSSGHMEVDISALEECLRRTALEIDDVIDAKARIHIQAGGLAKPVLCAVQVGLRERADVPGSGSEIGTRIKDRFLEIIPIDTPPVVNLNIRIRSAKRPAAAASEEERGYAAESEEAAVEEEQDLEDARDFTGERDYTGREADNEADDEEKEASE
jgi:hypothetical protein